MVAIRSHLVRPLDLTSPWNRAILALTAGAVGGGLYLSAVHDRPALLSVEAGGTTFLAWALSRELDPDRQVTALMVAVVGGVWALIGMETAILPFAALLLVARIMVETTGRRPLPTDLGAMALAATLVSFTRLGWIMGFGIAIALYVDDRLADAPSRPGMLAALGAAVGSSVMASLTDVFPRDLLEVRPLLVVALGLLALVAVLRDPVDPVSFVDSRNKRFLRKDRLHAGRAVTALLVVVGALVTGEAAVAVIPMAIVVATALASSEVERLRRVTPT